MSRATIIEDARMLNPWFEEYAGEYDSELTAACDTLALNGLHDDVMGCVDTFGLFYLIDCCILRVYADGFMRTWVFAAVEPAEAEWRHLASEYADWCASHPEELAYS